MSAQELCKSCGGTGSDLHEPSALCASCSGRGLERPKAWRPQTRQEREQHRAALNAALLAFDRARKGRVA